MRALSVAILSRPGARQSSRYFGKEFPPFKTLVRAVHQRCTELLSTTETNAVTPHHVQSCLVVSFQVLMPPMRGKPFYTLRLSDLGNNSMFL